MWTKVKDSDCFISFTQDNVYEICVTNFICVWTISYWDKAFITQLKASNEGLELANDNEFLQKGLYLFTNLDKAKKLSIKKDGNNLLLIMKVMFGYPFCFECKLVKGSDEFYFEKVTRPLLKTISDLRSSQNELRGLLIKKDKEIDEYKCEGGEIVLRHLKTVAFNDEEHMKKYNKYEENFGSANIPTTLIEKCVEINRYVKKEPIPEPKIKQEPNSIPNIMQEPITELNPRMSANNETNQTQSTTLKNIIIKDDSHAPTFEDVTPFVNCKQEVFQSESQSNLTDHHHRKRMKKLNL